MRPPRHLEDVYSFRLLPADLEVGSSTGRTSPIEKSSISGGSRRSTGTPEDDEGIDAGAE